MLVAPFLRKIPTSTKRERAEEILLIKLHRTSRDATGFIDTVEAVAAGMLRESAGSRFVAVHIDNWFDQKWLRFSGKMLGAFGVWKSGKHLTLPPFVPNRVLSEAWWVRAPVEDDYRRQEDSTPLHSRMGPEQNRNRSLALAVGNATLLWYSGNSIAAGRGAIMVYEALEAGYRCWYANVSELHGAWKLTGQKGISREEFLELETRSKSIEPK